MPLVVSRCLRARRSGLARGELMQRRDAFSPSLEAERYLERCMLKTARLFECACLVGADPEPSADAATALTLYGREIGLAFQLLDDVLDITGPSDRTGKARGTDLLDGTVTLPMIRARERDPSLAEIDLSGLDAESAAALCDRIAATGVLEEVRADARGRVEAAKAGACRTRDARRAATRPARAWSPTASSTLLLTRQACLAIRSLREGCRRRAARRRSARSARSCWPE